MNPDALLSGACAVRVLRQAKSELAGLNTHLPTGSNDLFHVIHRLATHRATG
jgi:hypothetical protein